MDVRFGEAPHDFSSPDRSFDFLVNRLAVLLETAKGEIDCDRQAARTSLATAASILHSEIERRSSPKNAKAGGLAGWQVTRVRSFVDKNLHRSISTTELSVVAQRSTAHFSRSFKLTFGEPPHAYIVRRRLEEACYLMLTTSSSLSEIALNVGLSDQAHLCRLFRQVFDQSPASWRREREVRR